MEDACRVPRPVGQELVCKLAASLEMSRLQPAPPETACRPEVFEAGVLGGKGLTAPCEPGDRPVPYPPSVSIEETNPPGSLRTDAQPGVERAERKPANQGPLGGRTVTSPTVVTSPPTAVTPPHCGHLPPPTAVTSLPHCGHLPHRGHLRGHLPHRAPRQGPLGAAPGLAGTSEALSTPQSDLNITCSFSFFLFY